MLCLSLTNTVNWWTSNHCKWLNTCKICEWSEISLFDGINKNAKWLLPIFNWMTFTVKIFYVGNNAKSEQCWLHYGFLSWLFISSRFSNLTHPIPIVQSPSPYTLVLYCVSSIHFQPSWMSPHCCHYCSLSLPVGPSLSRPPFNKMQPRGERKSGRVNVRGNKYLVG